MNDGSTDKSLEICKEFAANDKRIKVIHKMNAGQSSARNVGINAAHGKYIGFMDNDDLLYPDMCKHLYENAEKYGAVISACSYVIKDEIGNITHNKHIGNIFIYDNKQDIKELLSRVVVDIYFWTKLYRKDFLDRQGIRFEEGRSEEDRLFNYSAYIVADRTVMADILVYTYMERKESTCRTFHQKKFYKYMDDICFRMRTVENGVTNKYPDLAIWAKKKQSMLVLELYSLLQNIKKKNASLIIHG